MGFLKEKGIFTLVHYPVPMHRQKFLLRFLKGRHFPVAEKLAQEIMSIPMYPYLENNEIDYIIESINNYRVNKCR